MLQQAKNQLFTYRWLFATGKNCQGKSISQKIAKRNGVVLPENVWEKAIAKVDENSYAKFVLIL